MEIESSQKLQLGDTAPDFSLKGVDGNTYSLSSFDKDILVIIFSCNHCPYVQANETRMIQLQNDFPDTQFVAINANSAVNYPQDDFDHMVERAQEKGFNFPYLRDATQDIAKAYGAQVTPEVFVFQNKQLVYHGRIDENTYKNEAGETHDLKNALQALTTPADIIVKETPAVGCSIKWDP